MTATRLGIIMYGATGRIGVNQHLANSLDVLRRSQLKTSNGRLVELDLILVGRDPQKLAEVAAAHGISRWTTDLDSALADESNQIFFDCAATNLRYGLLEKAIRAGKHVYCEKPLAERPEEAVRLANLATQRGVKHGVVMANLWLPGLVKLQRLLKADYFGKVLSVRGEFGYWIFEGDWQLGQRPSWNYRAEDGGGIILDMLCHWHYMLAQLFGPITQVHCMKSTQIQNRWDEQGRLYRATAEDTAFVTGLIEDKVPVQINVSWATRVRRDDLLTIHIDGTHGSAVVGARDCFIQPRTLTPKPVWNPDSQAARNYFADWSPVPDNQTFENAFKAQWQAFIDHVVTGVAFPWDFFMGAEGVQLAATCHTSAEEKRLCVVPRVARPADHSTTQGCTAG